MKYPPVEDVHFLVRRAADPRERQRGRVAHGAAVAAARVSWRQAEGQLRDPARPARPAGGACQPSSPSDKRGKKAARKSVERDRPAPPAPSTAEAPGLSPTPSTVSASASAPASAAAAAGPGAASEEPALTGLAARIRAALAASPRPAIPPSEQRVLDLLSEAENHVSDLERRLAETTAMVEHCGRTEGGVISLQRPPRARPPSRADGAPLGRDGAGLPASYRRSRPRCGSAMPAEDEGHPTGVAFRHWRGADLRPVCQRDGRRGDGRLAARGAA